MLLATIVATSPFLSGQAVADLIPGSSFQRGNWYGDAYTYDDGTFSHCAISADYQSGDSIILTVTSEANIGVGVVSPRLGMRPGGEYAISVRIDQRYFSQAIAEARDEQYFVFFLTDFAQALDAIRFGNTMFVQGNGFLGEYALTSTSVALEAARQCALHYLDYRAPGTAPQSQPEAVASGFDRTYLFQAATEMITALGLSDPRYFTEAEMREAGASMDDVYWISEAANLMGGVYIAPSEGQSLRQLDGVDTQHLASMCDGDFATSARDLDGYSAPAREIRLICTETEQPHEVFLTKIQLGDMVLYSELRFFDGGGSESSGRPRTADSEAVTARLASFAVE
jgi:hypothetical protein